MAALAPRRHEAASTDVPMPSAARAPQPLRPPASRMTMYFSPDGALHHARCRRPLHFLGIRAEIESDFFCTTCHEHVAVPRYAVPQIPIETPTDTPAERKNVVRLIAREAATRRSAG